MLLAIDAGNTNVVFALCDGPAILHRWRIATDPKRTADQYGVWLSQLFAMERLPHTAVTGAIIATVVPQALFDLELLCRKYFGVAALVVGEASVRLPIEVRLANPAEVGADRLVNALAASAVAPGPIIIIDFGTATTFDVVGAEGAYEGGVIAPGINLSLSALIAAAARLPRITIEPPPEGAGVIGKSTIHAMQSGIFTGYVSLIEGLVDRIKCEIGQPARVIATGGLAPLFDKATDRIDEVEPDLTIHGLIRLYDLNRDSIETSR